MISVCIITRDEAPKLKKCLEAVRTHMAGIEYEIVVIDTGSLDDSIAVTREYTQRVFEFEWCGDFATAKNYSIEKASSDYIIHLDTDEYLEDTGLNQTNSFCASLKESGIEARSFWKPVHLQKPYKDCPHGDLRITEGLCERIITLPCSTCITDEELETVVEVVRYKLIDSGIGEQNEHRV